jgi:hypothetical protein
MIWSKGLTAEEWTIAVECLRAAAKGPFFGDELHTVTGFEANELMQIYQRRERIDDADEEAERAIGQCVLNFIGYPHKQAEEMEDWLAANGLVVARIADKWFHNGKSVYASRYETP